MPLRSLAKIRNWLIPWTIAPFAILAMVFVSATPPRELWLPMILSSLGIFWIAGIVTGLCWAVAIAALKVPLASIRSLVLAALAGAFAPLLLLGTWFLSPNASVLIFAALGAIAAWRVTPITAAVHVAPAAAPTT